MRGGAATAAEAEQTAFLARARAGDRVAFDRLVAPHLPRLAQFAADGLGGDADHGQDALQAALVEAWRDLPALREPAAFAGWLRRIVAKQCDRLRRGARVTVALESVGEPAAPGSDPAGALLARDEDRRLRRSMHAAILSLPPGERVAVLLFYSGGCSHRDVAEFLKVSVPAVKSRLHSARRRLRERMADVMGADELSSMGLTGDLTAEERADALAGVEACYARYMDAFDAQDPEASLALLTDDYELIFPADFGEPNWDRARVEQDIRKANRQNAGTLRMRAVVEELLSAERDPATGAVVQMSVRTTFLQEGPGFRDRCPIPRIDTFRRVAVGVGGWRLRRTLSLFHRGK